MKKTILSLCLVIGGLSSVIAHDQPQEKPNVDSYNLMGHIGDKRVKMHLKYRGDNKVTGYYGQATLTPRNNYVKHRYHVQGHIDQQKHLKLTVYPPGNAQKRHMIKAHFKQKQDQSKLIGHWFNQPDTPQTKSKTINLRQYHIQYHDYQLTDQHKFKTNSRYCYTMEIHYPHLKHPRDTQTTDKFNKRVNKLINSYRKSIIQEMKTTDKAKYKKFSDDQKCPNIDQDMLWIDYIVTNVQSDILSLRFEITRYSARAAHPNHNSYALNYDLQRNQFIELDALFQPNVNYLQKMANFSRDQLNQQLSEKQQLDHFQKRWIREGTEAKAKNFQHHWNLRPEGLLLYFGPYQVAPYAYGDIELLMPADKIQPLLGNQYTDLFSHSQANTQ